MSWSGLTIRSRTKKSLTDLREELRETLSKEDRQPTYSEVIDYLIELYKGMKKR